MNEQMLVMYGYRKEEVLGLTLDSFRLGIAPYDQKGAEEKIRTA